MVQIKECYTLLLLVRSFYCNTVTNIRTSKFEEEGRYPTMEMSEDYRKYSSLESEYRISKQMYHDLHHVESTCSSYGYPTPTFDGMYFYAGSC